MRFGPSMSCFQRSSTLGWLTLCRRRNLGYLVHPSLATRLDRFSRIADIGTGTGIYLIELSRQLPATCRLDGFDISDVQYPSPEALPANVSLALQNAKQAFPAALKGKYGLVHLRLLMSAMEKDDWEVVAANAVRLLKPGGAIQWAEGDFLHSAYLRSGSETGPKNLEHVAQRFHEGIGHRLQYGHSTLPAIFEQQGLRGVFQDIVASDRISETRKNITRISYDGIFGWANQMHIKGAPGAWTLQEIKELRRKCEEEILAGGYCRFEIYVTIGYTQ